MKHPSHQTRPTNAQKTQSRSANHFKNKSIIKTPQAFTSVLGLCIVLTLGCNKSTTPENATQNANLLTRQEFSTSGLDEETFDINQDGIIDQYQYSKDGVVQIVIRDFNFDGVQDMTEFYQNNQHSRDEIDLDFDGICDLIITYENGVAVKKDYAIDFQGNRHGTQIFDAQGQRIEIHRDTDDNGSLDTIEYFHPGEETPYKTTHATTKDIDL